MADSGEYVRTVMDPMDNRYHFVLIIILISLIIATGISVFFSGEPDSSPPSSVHDSVPLSEDRNPESESGESYIVRVLWYDDQNRTYSFQDYPSLGRPDPETYSYSGLPPVSGAKTAMIRFLSWDGHTERTLGARYIVDQETVTSILNRYSLTQAIQPEVSMTVTQTRTPEPSATPIEGMLIPESGTICRNADGSYTAYFGYSSRHEYPVKLPVGEQNLFFPGEKDRGQPVVFLPGIHHEVFSITYPANVTNQVWSLMGKKVSAGMVPMVNTSIVIEPDSGYAPLEVWLTERSTGGTIDNPLYGIWDLGDGMKTENTGSFTYRYENPGIYPVTYTVQNRCNQVSASARVTVYQTSYSLSVDKNDPDTIHFMDNSGGEPSVWFWDFGDGYSSWDQNPVHTYLYPGTYRAGLTVSGQYGRGTVVRLIEIPAVKKV